MRDLETISLALTAAETGHLVFATLHTKSAPKTIDRIIDAFPPASSSRCGCSSPRRSRAWSSQLLLPTKDKKGRVAAIEIMVATIAIRNLIREAKTHQMPSAIQTGTALGMQSLEQALKTLVMQSRVDKALADGILQSSSAGASGLGGAGGGGTGAAASGR